MKLSCLFISLMMVPVMAAGSKPAAKQDIATIISTQAIHKQPGRYLGWPTIAKLPNGQLAVVFSGDRDWHVCPWGKTQMVVSDDNGATWSDVKTINNTPLDDRDAGILVTDKGTVLVSWFTSLEFANPESPQYKNRYYVYDRHSEKLIPEIRQQWLGNWVRRSTDMGKSWGEFIKTPGNSPHGPIQLKDGRLLYVTNTGVSESADDGLTWKVIGAIPVEKDTPALSEVHAVETEDGVIVALSRAKILRQSFSYDGGRTWTVPHQTPLAGYPAHLIKLRNHWLAAVYARRSQPRGQFACISKDGGKTWDVEHEITLCLAVPQEGADLGYPASVQLEDGSIFTIYYQVAAEGEMPCIMGTHWRLNEGSAD